MAALDAEKALGQTVSEERDERRHRRESLTDSPSLRSRATSIASETTLLGTVFAHGRE